MFWGNILYHAVDLQLGQHQGDVASRSCVCGSNLEDAIQGPDELSLLRLRGSSWQHVGDAGVLLTINIHWHHSHFKRPVLLRLALEL